MKRENSILVTFIESIEDPVVHSGNPESQELGSFEEGDQAFIPKDFAEIFLENNQAVRYGWKCLKCGEKIYDNENPERYEEEPPICPNPNCENKTKKMFRNLHPEEHYEVGKLLVDCYDIRTIMESIQGGQKPGRIFVRTNGVFQDDGAIGFIKNVTRNINPQIKTHFHSNVLSYIEDKTATPEEDFGLEPPEVCVKNGVLNPNTGKVREITDSDIVLNQIPWEYEPDAECPEFKEYYEKWIPNEKKRILLQELLGTALIQDKLHKKMAFLIGPTDAGKSTFLNIITAVLGPDNVSNQSPYQLSRTRWGKNKIYGKLLNASHEVEAKQLSNLSLWKKMGDGNPITAEAKSHPTYEFEPFCEHVYLTNQTPTAERTDDAFWNRILPVKFPEKVSKKDQAKNLDKKIIEEEFQGILNWLIEGYKRFHENGDKFTEDLNWRDVRDSWLEEGNSIQQFIQKKVVKDVGNKIKASELHNIYSQFAQENEMEVESQSKLSGEVKKLDFAKYSNTFRFDGKQDRGFKGIAVKEESKKLSQEVLAEKLARDYWDLEDPRDVSLEEFAKEEASRYNEDFERVKGILEHLENRRENPLIFSKSDSTQTNIEEVEKIGA